MFIYIHHYLNVPAQASSTLILTQTSIINCLAVAIV